MVKSAILQLLVLHLMCVAFVFGAGCNNVPRVQHGPKSPGDNGYRLMIGGEPSGYVPGKTYNLFLLGSRTHNNFQQFVRFQLTGKTVTSLSSPKYVGRFQLFSDSLTKFSDECINTVVEADDLPKSEVQAMWVAPKAGSGCITLSAMIFEDTNRWFANEGALQKTICEKRPDIGQIQQECCACNEAKYNMIFEGIWSNETHPKDYPFAVWLTHFSDVIGASHDSNFSFWGENHIATDGFRSLAEWGSVRVLEQELRVKGSRLRTLIKAAGLWYPNVNSNTSSHFRVDRKHHKVSLASMFGPSPDWVVGVSGLNLCTPDCDWKEAVDVDLYPWDAGTDSGISYMSPNAETQPRERMHKITTLYPEDPRAPFYNADESDMIPLAKLYIRREKVIPKSCDDTFLQAQVLDVSENTEETVRPECDTTDFTPWNQCSVTCGKGIRMRTRSYRNPEKAQMFNCNRQLVSKEMCVADIPECDTEPTDDEGENLAESDALEGANGEGVGVCRTTPWSEYSECSASCGIGVTMKTRTFIDPKGRKKCPHVSVVEKEKCMKPECSVTEIELPDPQCPVLPFSDWSPCSVSCGKGVQIRTRLLLVDPDKVEMCTKRIQLHQQRPCTERVDCTFDMDTTKEICSTPIDAGPCRGSYNRFAYNMQTHACVPFVYGGCRGNKNNFLTSDDCMQHCDVMRDQVHDTNAVSSPNVHIDRDLPVDCVLSEWTGWTTCSVSCGTGRQEKFRNVLVESQNGGVPCPKRILKRRKCVGPPCADGL